MKTLHTKKAMALAAGGAIFLQVGSAFCDTHFVSPSGGNVSPFTSWTDAARVIQDALDKADPGDTVLVADGVYTDGETPVGELANRVVIREGVTLRSVNGPKKTAILGDQRSDSSGMRCAYLFPGATLSGFSLLNGTTPQRSTFDPDLSGGGARCHPSSVVSNSVFSGNSAMWAGAVYGGTVHNSVLVNNVAHKQGGGAVDSTLINCLIRKNVGDDVGGAATSILMHCTVVENITETYPIRSEGVGGVRDCDVGNSIVVDNRYRQGLEANFTGGRFLNSCVSPLPQDGQNNIASRPLFKNAEEGDFRLEALSPCVDAGDNLFAQEPFDLAGDPRIRGVASDIGAYEFFHEGRFTLFLEGAYEQSTGRMTTHLRDNEFIPLTSPYASDPRTVAQIPSRVTDWVLMEIREKPDSAARSSRSVFLLDNGRVVTETGSEIIDIEVDPDTDYYVFIKHRNHLGAMTTHTLNFSQRDIGYDFRPYYTQYLGEIDVAVEVDSGIWASRTGDVNGLGSVNSNIDLLMYNDQAGLDKGYYRADVNLDGYVNSMDKELIVQRFETTSPVPRPEVRLSPSGTVSPPRRTLVEGESLDLTASGFKDPITWGFEENNSGGSLSDSIGSRVTYTAGNNPGSVDIVQAWDTHNRLALAFLNIISTDESAALGKAVIIAGGRDLQDPVWDATDYLAGKAYNTLRYRGFSSDLIQYLSFGPHRDVNGDGDPTNDITFANATGDNVTSVFTDWVSSTPTDRLTVYMVDHGTTTGSSGQFRLNAQEFIAAATVDQWLDDLQDAQPDLHVTVVLDFCYAGSTLDELQYHVLGRRVVVSSTANDELAYFISTGQISFSEFFFNGILLGSSVFDTFELGQNAMKTYQSAWIDDTQDGAYTDGTDGAFAETEFIGASFIAGKDFPIIGKVFENQVLTKGSSATLWADDIDSFYLLKRVWCTITPPGFSPDPNTGVPVVNVTTRDLTFNPLTGRHETIFDGFTEPGQYIVSFFAQDIWDSVSPSKQTAVVQAGFLEKVVLVAGGETSDPIWPAVRSTTHLAYETFRSRLIAPDNIYVLSNSPFEDFDGDSANDINASNSSAEVQDAITSWADNGDRLTVYLIGDNDSDNFRLSGGEVVDPTSLDTWLDYFQRSNRTVNVVLEFAGSGGFIPFLQPPPDEERYTFASSAAGRQQTLTEELSYSTFFLSEIFNGESLGIASRRARKGIRRASGNIRQKGFVDDNNNGIPNEKNIDEVASMSRFIGSPFFTGEDIPNITEVNPETTTSESSILLYADGVSDADGIAKVWVEITTSTNHTGSLSVEFGLLENMTSGRWEGTYTEFVKPGFYALTFYAEDGLGNVSAGVQSRILKTDEINYVITDPSLPDQFEPENTSDGALYSDLPLIQVHSLHGPDDVDWVKFYATDDLIYDIETVYLETNNLVDTSVEVYREEPDGALTLLDSIDEFGRDEGELTGLDFPANGFYLVRVSHASDSEFSSGSYLLSISVPAGLEGVNVRVLDILSAAVLPGATVHLKNAAGTVLGTDTSDAWGYARFASATAGTYRVEVTAPGASNEYLRLFNPNSAIKGPDDPTSDYGNERLVSEDAFGVISYSGMTMAQTTYLAFGFLPVAYLEGVVKNGLTGERVAGAALAILRDSNSYVFSRYPWANYASAWLTDVDGEFPDTMIVPPNISATPLVVRNGYSNYVHASSISTPAQGKTMDVGTLILSSTYGGNDIPDFWELSHGLATNVNATLDSDLDGRTHLEEWVAGTDPNDSLSYFHAEEVEKTASGYTLRWIAAPGRWYSIQRNDNLTGTNGWALVYGPVQNGYTYATSEWSDSTLADENYYRLEVSEPTGCPSSSGPASVW